MFVQQIRSRSATLGIRLFGALVLAASVAPAGAAASARAGTGPPAPSAAECRATHAHRRAAPIVSWDAKPRAPRVFAMQFKQEARHVVSYATFRRKIECMLLEYVVPRLASGRPNVVAFNEDVGLATVATGTRGRQAREIFTGGESPSCDRAGYACGALGALVSVGGAYAPQVAAYRLRLDVQPVSEIFVAATDTFVRGWMQTFSDMARRYGIYILGSNNQAPFRESREAADIATFADPDLPTPASVYVATDARVYNEVFMWGPHAVRADGPGPLRNVVARNKKVPLIELEKQIGVTPGPSTGPEARANVMPYRLPGTQARLAFATSLPAFIYGPPNEVADPCQDTSRYYMRCLDRLGANLVVQDEANPAKWAAYAAGDADTGKVWQPLVWMASTWRAAADPEVRFSYNVTPHLVGNLADLPFDGQTAITQRGLGVDRPESRACTYIGNSRFLPGVDPRQGRIAGETLAGPPFAGPKTQFLALAPWVVPDAPRETLERVSTELGPDGNGPLENDYLETAVIADLPFPANARRRGCATAAEVPGRPRIRLTVRPGVIVAGTRRRLRFQADVVRHGELRPVAGAVVSVAGRRVRLGGGGRGTAVVRWRTSGRKRVTATAAGAIAGAAWLRVVSRTRRERGGRRG